MSKYDHYTILLNNIYPPIPNRRFDWQATLDGYEPGEPIGYGETKLKALEDLIDQIEERE